jgi:hypothetical protein
MQSFHLPEEVLDVVNLDFEESDLFVGHLLLKKGKQIELSLNEGDGGKNTNLRVYACTSFSGGLGRCPFGGLRRSK